MNSELMVQVKEIVCNTIRTGFSPQTLPDSFRLAGEALDSMAVTNLILALEEYFGFAFEDEDLAAEDFATVASLSQLVTKKLEPQI